jgi:hypothetical protein
MIQINLPLFFPQFSAAAQHHHQMQQHQIRSATPPHQQGIMQQRQGFKNLTEFENLQLLCEVQYIQKFRLYPPGYVATNAPANTQSTAATIARFSSITATACLSSSARRPDGCSASGCPSNEHSFTSSKSTAKLRKFSAAATVFTIYAPINRVSLTEIIIKYKMFGF